MKIPGAKGIFKLNNIIKNRSKELKQVKLNWKEENKFNHMTDYSTVLKKKSIRLRETKVFTAITAKIL